MWNEHEIDITRKTSNSYEVTADDVLRAASAAAKQPPVRKFRLTTTSRVARARRSYAWGPSLSGDADEYNLQTHASRKPTNSHLTSLSPFSRNTRKDR